MGCRGSKNVLWQNARIVDVTMTAGRYFPLCFSELEIEYRGNDSFGEIPYLYPFIHISHCTTQRMNTENQWRQNRFWIPHYFWLEGLSGLRNHNGILPGPANCVTNATWYEAVARYLANGSAAFIKICAAIGQVRLGTLVRNYFSVRTILNSTGCCKLPR